MSELNKDKLIELNGDFHELSDKGFCDSEFKDTAHGEYTWSETEVGQTDEQECVFGNKDGYEGGTAQRTCLAPHSWSNYTGEACITRVTYDIRQLAEVIIIFSIVYYCV